MFFTWDSEGAVILSGARYKRSETRHKEMKSREWHHVHCQFSQISVQLTGEPKASCHTRHCQRHQMIEIAVFGAWDFQCAEANIVQCFVVNAVGFIGVLNQLMDRERCIVWLDNGVGHFWRWNHRVSVHNSIRILFANFRNQQSAHAGTGTTSKRMRQLETLEITRNL